MSGIQFLFKSLLFSLVMLMASQARADSVTVVGYCGSWTIVQPTCNGSYSLEQGGPSFTERVGSMLFDVAYRGDALVVTAKQEVPAGYDLINGAYTLHYNVYDSSQPFIPDRNMCSESGSPSIICNGNKLAGFSRTSFPRHVDQPWVLPLRSAVPEPSAAWLLLLGLPMAWRQRLKKLSAITA